MFLVFLVSLIFL